MPTWLRTILSLIVLVIGVGLTIVGWAGRPQLVEQRLPSGRITEITTPSTPGSRAAFRFGLGITVVGCILVATSGKSKSEEKGYRI